jgi:hypothetical protein
MEVGLKAVAPVARCAAAPESASSISPDLIAKAARKGRLFCLFAETPGACANTRPGLQRPA